MGYSRAVARPTGVRTLAGYTLGDRLAQDVYGEVYRASEGKRAFTLLVVEPRLAGDRRFADALSGGTAPLLGELKHRSIVGTVVVAHDGKSLVVVTDGVAGVTTLADLLARVKAKGGKLPAPIAAAIGRAVVDGVQAAHFTGVVHGALHPRSVWIDGDGVVRVTDFAVGCAAMTAAAQGSEALPLKSLAGYLAPELAVGDSPTPASDVYAVGAILFAMLTGETPPGSLNTTPAVERLVQRALETDLARRFGDAIELQENFIEALEDDRWESATPAEVAQFVAEHGAAAASDGSLDAATEDLLASLGGHVDTTRQTVPARGALDSVLSELDDASSDGSLTVVDEPRGQAARDPISELIALDEDNRPTQVVEPEHTPLPPPQPDEPGTLTRQGTDPRVPLRRPEPVAQPSRLVEKTRPPAASAARAASPEPEADAEPAEPAKPQPKVRFVRPASEPPPPVATPSLRRSMIWTWLGIAALVAGGVFLVQRLREQKKELTAGEQAAKEARARGEAANAETERRLRAEQADPGSIVVRAPEGATVWLLLGRTPFDSIPLTTKSVWEMRAELDGHKTQDVRVGGPAWSGPDDNRKARVDVALEVGANEPPLPSIPAAPPAADHVGLVDGSGILHAESKPQGAAFWLLIGNNTTNTLKDIEAGRDYELRVIKEGYLPGYIRISAEEWRHGGDPRLPLSSAPKHDVLERTVELVPAPKKPG